MGEILVIAVLGLLVFGPDRLPKAIKTLASGVKALRASATDATRSLQDAAGFDGDDTRKAMDELASLHPKRLMGSILDDANNDLTGSGSPGSSPSTRSTGSRSAPARSTGLGEFDPDAP